MVCRRGGGNRAAEQSVNTISFYFLRWMSWKETPAKIQ